MEKEKRSVLIVDDERINLEILNYILKTDYVVYIARNGNTAIEIAKKNKPDLIVLDIIMPDISGFDVLKTLKNNDQTKNIPVVLVTGLNNPEYQEKGITHGAVGYIIKPYKHEVVKELVNRHILSASNG